MAELGQARPNSIKRGGGMQPLKIVSMLRVNGEWVEQSTLPKHIASEMIRDTIIRAANQIGFEEERTKKEEHSLKG